MPSSSASKTLKLGVLALDGMLLSSASAVIDTLLIAQRIADIRMPGQVRLEGELVSARGATEVTSANGLVISGVRPSVPEDLDLLVVPGLMHGSAHDLYEHATRSAAEVACLRERHLRGAASASTCCGTFILAESGALDGRKATTSWWLSAAFRTRYPQVELLADAMVVEDGPVMTSGGGTGVTDLVLRLIARAAGDELAQQTARIRLVDPERQSQAPFISEAMIERPRHSLSEKAERLLNDALHQDLTVGELAARLGTSERSLLRHFRQHYGETPLANIQRRRIERAKALLESTLLSFDEIVGRCGYSDTSSFRKLFKRATSLTPADYRERYRLRSH